jgi:ABC-type bacteriocin/lantibiotic exporter with double-glycine peptidase domain
MRSAKKRKSVLQRYSWDCGIACMYLIAKKFGLTVESYSEFLDKILEKYRQTKNKRSAKLAFWTIELAQIITDEFN